jgi:hypothetical protein
MRRLFLSVLLVVTSLHAAAFESDVHFGLTQWLALQAGFDSRAAATIATGDQRVDSGDMQYVDLDLMDACVGKDDVGARRAGAHHYPSAGALPGSPETRVVAPGGEVPMRLAIDATKVPPDQSLFRMYVLGEALHTLQDSWSHQGIPDVPQWTRRYFDCDPMRAWGHPKSRGGFNSHKADLTHNWPSDTVAMAKATYDVLLQYPAPSGTKRTAKAWDELRPTLSRFVSASTKSEKKDWFTAQGISDVSFLEGVSLTDGTVRFDGKWPGRKLPPLNSIQSRQHDIAPELLNFYNRFFAQWLSGTDFEAQAAEFGVGAPAKGRHAKTAAGGRDELAGRLRAWRLGDHGRVAEIAHSLQALTSSQRATLNAIGRRPNAYASYDKPQDGLFPLLPREAQVSPLLPFYVAVVKSEKNKAPTAVAVAKFRHAPYDTVAVVSEKVDGRWRIVSIASVVDH